MTTTAIIVVDVQNDFCEGGALAVKGGNTVAEQVGQALTSKHTPRDYDYLVATQDWHISPGAHWAKHEAPDFSETWPEHCKAGTKGAWLHPALDAVQWSARFRKGHFSAAYSGFEGYHMGITLGEWLRNRQVDTVDIVGIALDYCVKATALDAARLGFKTTLIVDLTAAVAAKTAVQACNEMAAAGVHLYSTWQNNGLPRVGSTTTTEGI